MVQVSGNRDNRQHARYNMSRGAEVHLNQSGFFGLRKKKSVKLGALADLSLGGMSVRYSAKQVSSLKGMNLSIVMPGKGTLIEEIPFRIVADRDVDGSPKLDPLRRCGVAFGNLTEDQLSRLKILIKTYSEKKERSGAEPL